jgi:acetylornithine deacetylase/succinyl-diaminopimelate desuccinylase-like protein
MPERSQSDQIGAERLGEVAELLAIPSVSADPVRAPAVREAAAWVAEFVGRAGGRAEVVDWSGSPLVDGLISASVDPDGAPTVLCYGHVDVQPPEPLDLWEVEPFAATVRDGWLYGRGVADDKAQLWALLCGARDLAAAGELPVNVRVCCDGEEEVGGSSIVEYLEEHLGAPAACVIFDTPKLDDDTPVFTIGARGTLYLHVEVRTGRRDLHSGVYGGAALNALHVLQRALGRLFVDDVKLIEPLHAGVVPPTDEELESWSRLPPGAELLADQGAAPAGTDAGEEFYLRTWGLPSLDVNGVEGGSPVQPKTIVVAEARANLSMRLARGQDVDDMSVVVERELRRDLPEAATLELTVVSSCNPGRTSPTSAPVQLARAAFERAIGREPLLLRSGGSLPMMPFLERRGVPAIVTGFAVPDSNMHAPNERVRLADLADAVGAATETFRAFAALR